MKYLFFLFFLFSAVTLPAFGASHPEYSGIEDPIEYVLEFDENFFIIPYQVNSDVIAMAIDPKLTSLLIALENTSDSVFTIDLEHELIRAQNNEFAILVNGAEVDYEVVSDGDSSTLSFFVPAFTEEVEIIGTHVIPEFPLGAIMGFIILISIILVISRAKKPIFRL